jgi:D-alanine--poly(phosphoribitol) ligase subunit 1
MQLLSDLQHAISTHLDRNAFLIGSNFFTYSDFAIAISKIRKSIQLQTHSSEKHIALVTNDDLETYATIIALWLEGKAYIPISPESPKDRNENIIHQSFVRTIIDSSEKPLFPEFNLIKSKALPESEIDLEPKNVSDQELAYILFTSGTTGQPKGVPITLANLAGFINSFGDIGFKIDEEDKCLQMFELTFDFSVVSYLVPLLKGACLYTIPKNVIKYAYIYQLMDEQKLTVAGLVPSILYFLRPHFDELDFPSMKYSIFCGESLPLDITEEWGRCLPNAEIVNFYGPTEQTVFCTYYPFNKTSRNKEHNGVLSIGKAMTGNATIIVDDNNRSLSPGEQGELCLAGLQLTPGYWNNDKRNKESFFFRNVNGTRVRFYKTGDLCFIDEDGDIMYLGRIDFQTKIQGFRIELTEIEFHVKTFLEKANVVALPLKDISGNTEIGLVIESREFNTSPLSEYMKIKMPSYMIPKKICFADRFPLNTNGKTDRKKLELLFKETNNE